MAFKIRNTPLKAFAKSPLKQYDIDTRWVDQIYTKDRVDRDLVKKGHHTEGDLRGKVKTELVIMNYKAIKQGVLF